LLSKLCTLIYGVGEPFTALKQNIRGCVKLWGRCEVKAFNYSQPTKKNQLTECVLVDLNINSVSQKSLTAPLSVLLG